MEILPLPPSGGETQVRLPKFCEMWLFYPKGKLSPLKTIEDNLKPNSVLINVLSIVIYFIPN